MTCGRPEGAGSPQSRDWGFFNRPASSCRPRPDYQMRRGANRPHLPGYRKEAESLVLGRVWPRDDQRLVGLALADWPAEIRRGSTNSLRVSLRHSRSCTTVGGRGWKTRFATPSSQRLSKEAR